MDLDKMLGIDLSNPSHHLARILANQDEDLIDRLVKLRKGSGKSQQDIAVAMGVSQSAVARIESGDRDPHLSTVRRYSHAVGAVVSHSVESYDPDTSRVRGVGRNLSPVPQNVMEKLPMHVRKVLESQ